MDITRLTRHSHRRERPGPALLGRWTLPAARAHEFCGSARRRLALWTARETKGTVLWIRPDWHPDRLHMPAVRAEIDPARLIMVEARRPEDLLWSTEEALRTGCVALVVADLPEPPGLTPVRRLHLAAEAGAEASAGPAPLALLLTPGDGGAPGVETRWQLRPAHGAATDRWRLARLRARAEPPANWSIASGADGTPAVTAIDAVELSEA